MAVEALVGGKTGNELEQRSDLGQLVLLKQLLGLVPNLDQRESFKVEGCTIS